MGKMADRTMFIDRLLKKLGTSMTVPDSNNPSGLERGGGIQIIEGPNLTALETVMSILLILGFIFAVSYNAYMDIPNSPCKMGLWIVVTLEMVLLAFYFYFENK
jgi:hypothetical protein